MTILQMAEFLEGMEPKVRAGHWDRVEADGRDACVRLTGPAAAKEIDAVSLARYEGQLRSGLNRALKKARKLEAPAIYYEYDLDNGWDGNFFLCRDYVPQAAVEEADQGEEWAGDWIEAIPGPGQAKLAAIYSAQGGFAESSEQVGRTAFLVARTMAAFGRASEGLETHGIAVCLAFHDGEPIFRVREVAQSKPSSRAEDESTSSPNRYWKILPRETGMAQGPENFDRSAVPKPDEVLFTLQGGRRTDYLMNSLLWRVCSEPLMRLLRSEKSPSDDLEWIPVLVETGTERQRYFLLQASPRPDLLHPTTISSPFGWPMRVILDEARAKGHRIFIVHPDGSDLIVSADVKQKIKNAKLVGMYFRPVLTASSPP